MISLEEAQEILDKNSFIAGKKLVTITDSVGRVLAEDIHSDINMPPFNTSAMDGYACRREDLGDDLVVLEIIPAGVIPTKSVAKGQCTKIMTGAMVPEGANCVMKVEDTEEKETGLIRYAKERCNTNIRMLGEDIRTNDCVLRKGKLLKSKHIGLLAALGKVEVEVYKRLTAGVISTGSELVEPGILPEAGKIRNSNSYQIVAQLEEIGIDVSLVGIVPDDEKIIFEKIEECVNKNDVTIITGGVSVGDYDYVPAVLDRLGAKQHFHKIDIRPGKPILFSTKGKKIIFGIPGNPISAFTQLDVLVKPFLSKLMGQEHDSPLLLLTMDVDMVKKNTVAKTLIPVQIKDNGKVVPVEYNGSGHIGSLADAMGFAVIPRDVHEIKKGEQVYVRLI